MNHTTNYNLSQWEATDRVQRADFNADNAKIDAAIKAVDAKADGKVEIVTGTYMGNGAASQNIALGRRAKALLVCSDDGATKENRFIFGGLALDGAPIVRLDPSRNVYLPVLEITDTGFTVFFATVEGGAYVCTNQNGTRYHYIAFF